MKTSLTWSRTQVALHWVVVALLLAQYALHDGITAAWQARLDGSLPNDPFPNPHAIAGVVILALTLWRLALRLRLGAPAAPAAEPALLRRVAQITHLAIYALLISMPVSGALAWVAGLRLSAEWHEIAATVLLALILLHVAGALAQVVWFRSGAMARMSPARLIRTDPETGARR